MLEIDGAISMPHFVDGLQTQRVQYRVVGGVMHIGNTPASGHYRSFLSSFDGDPEPSAMQHAYITDDGQTAHLMSTDEKCLAKANVYLAWCARC